MILKKVYRNIHLDINIMGSSTTIENETVLEDICMTFSEAIILNKLEEFNTLINKQQQNNRHILIDNPKPFDAIRLLIKLINNFLIVTKQSLNFTFEALTYLGDDEIYAHSSEMYLGNISNITFSPLTRSHWTNPQLINQIINLG